MDLPDEAAAGGSETTPIAIAPAPAGDKPLGAREAARNLASWRHNRDKQSKDQSPDQFRGHAGEQRQTPAPVSASAGTVGAPLEPAHPRSEPVTGELADEANIGEPQAPPSETESADPAASDPRSEAGTEPPPIEPPRSWTKEDKELFTSLPRETQMRIAERERSREGDFLRRQAEAVEKLKGLSAKEQAVDQARLQYEAALPQLLLTLHDQQAGEFADIKTVADAERVAREDWPRYMKWDLTQKKIAFAQQQLLEAQQQHVSEQQQRFAQFARRQDELFIEKVPEFADAKKATELQSAAVTVLKGLGFDEAELAASWQGLKDLSLRDHRVQLLVRDASLWREAQQKAKAAVAKPVPPVQRPGVSHPKGAAQDAAIQNLNKQLENASGVNALRTAAKLVAAKRAAR